MSCDRRWRIFSGADLSSAMRPTVNLREGLVTTWQLTHRDEG